MASSSHVTRVSGEDLTIQDSWSLLRFLIGLCSSGAPSSNASPTFSPSSSSWYHSARIQRMIEKRGEFCTEVEPETEATVQSEIEASKVHWSEVDPAVSHTEHLGKINHECFELLKRREYVFEGDQIIFKQHDEEQESSLFQDSFGHQVVMGKKMAEGGQAEIYEGFGEDGHPCVVKVFKAGCLLRDILEKKIPPALLHSGYLRELCGISRATLLRDERFLNRFAFVMWKCWGDLRSLIDEKMMKSGNEGPPFPPKQVWGLMKYIARGMNRLHWQDPPILHNDLKAANVLVVLNSITNEPTLDRNGMYFVHVADFECSVGVLGTGFWRAPQILQQLKNKVAMSKVAFTDKCDVYSFGMTCYEFVSGRLPYEDHPLSDYDMVLNGGRPELPSDLGPLFREIITSCWHADPLERPSFEDIVVKLDANANSFF